MSLLFSPLSILLVAFVVMTAGLLLGRRWLVWLAAFAGLPALGLMTPLGANLLVLVIEHQVKAHQLDPVCEDYQVVVLLAGGLRRPAEHPDDFGALADESLTRVFTYLRRQPEPDLPLVISGSGPFRLPEPVIIEALIDRLDARPPTVTLEAFSMTTRESAVAVAELLPPDQRRIGLASSALHLPRARMAFRQAGFEVCPLRLNHHYLAAFGPMALLPRSSALRKSEIALHEVIGLAWYWLRPARVDSADGSVAYSPASSDLRGSVGCFVPGAARLAPRSSTSS